MSQKIIVLLSIVSVTLPSSSAIAGCGTDSKTVFSCQVAKGKIIQVCDAGKMIEYSFGKAKTPDIVVRVPRNEAPTSQWNGIGRYLSYTIDVPNGNTIYSVFWGSDRVTDEHKIEAGVNVEINNQLAATVKCIDEKSIIQNIEGIDLKPTE